ncbi:corneodesmosin-like [Pararge aegeria]|uniref:Jg12378 protein n=1 Tax=Pararge aegeria aegeria TaxID=348720 RepID=A0A8S4S6Y1_9NEOP|nr:corneodesmosin-like [Pararge aegeria]CAH2258563.1 jg12378 [Pararge aegeria aegeria]
MTLKITFSVIVLVCLIQIINCGLESRSTDSEKPSGGSPKTDGSGTDSGGGSTTGGKTGSENGGKGDSGACSKCASGNKGADGAGAGDKGGSETDGEGGSEKSDPIKEIKSKLDNLFKKWFSSFGLKSRSSG